MWVHDARQSLSVTDVLAVWGAGLSSIALVWNLYRDLRDRAKVKVSAHLRRLAKGEDGSVFSVKPDLPVEGATEKLFVVINATNVGRRPVKIKGWGGYYHRPVNGKKHFTVIPIGMPKMLNEGEDHTEYTDELVGRVENLKKLYEWDTSGRDWPVARGGLKKLKDEALSLQ